MDIVNSTIINNSKIKVKVMVKNSYMKRTKKKSREGTGRRNGRLDMRGRPVIIMKFV